MNFESVINHIGANRFQITVKTHFYFRFQTAFHKASAVGNFDLVKLLISSALQLYGEMELKRLLQEVDLDHNTPLWLAVEAGSASIIELLIEYGSNVNHFNKSKVYPLHSACTNGSLAIVQNLVKVNATEVHSYLCQNIANWPRSLQPFQGKHSFTHQTFEIGLIYWNVLILYFLPENGHSFC